jgi:hypothetical protein
MARCAIFANAAAVVLAAWCLPAAHACLGTPKVVSGSYATAKPVDNSTAYKLVRAPTNSAVG